MLEISLREVPVDELVEADLALGFDELDDLVAVHLLCVGPDPIVETRSATVGLVSPFPHLDDQNILRLFHEDLEGRIAVARDVLDLRPNLVFRAE